MSVIGTVSAGMQGALMLARGRPEGLQLVDADHAAAARSFWAIPLCLPAVICLKLLDWVQTGVPANVPLALGRYLVLFVLGWLLFVWLSHSIVARIDKQALWPRFVAIWSYCSVVENTLVALGGVPGVLGAPASLDQVSQLITVGWAFWLEWYAIRLALRTGPLTAGLFLCADFGIGMLMALIGAALGS